jgi:hypothetical protein
MLFRRVTPQPSPTRLHAGRHTHASWPRGGGSCATGSAPPLPPPRARRWGRRSPLPRPPGDALRPRPGARQARQRARLCRRLARRLRPPLRLEVAAVGSAAAGAAAVPPITELCPRRAVLPVRLRPRLLQRRRSRRSAMGGPRSVPTTATATAPRRTLLAAAAVSPRPSQRRRARRRHWSCSPAPSLASRAAWPRASLGAARCCGCPTPAPTAACWRSRAASRAQPCWLSLPVLPGLRWA